ncbi:hypothetical protein ES703_110657 [subsurface metagenome]
MLVCKPFAGPAYSGRNFVEDYERSIIVAETADCLKILFVRDVYTTFALNRLDHNGRHFITESRFECGNIVERDISEARQQRQQTFVVLRLSGCRQGGKSSPVEAALGGDEFIFFLRGVQACKFKRCLVCFGAAVAKKALAAERPFA